MYNKINYVNAGIDKSTITSFYTANVYDTGYHGTILYNK